MRWSKLTTIHPQGFTVSVVADTIQTICLQTHNVYPTTFQSRQIEVVLDTIYTSPSKMQPTNIHSNLNYLIRVKMTSNAFH
jgi:hypothetical protein